MSANTLKLPDLNQTNNNHTTTEIINGVVITTEEDPKWRANELRKRVIQRREEARGKQAIDVIKRKHLEDKRRKAIVQRWKDKKIREKAHIGEAIRKYEKKSMQFLERADVQWKLDIKLRALDRTVTSTTTNIRDAIAKLNASEKRIHAAREKIARPRASKPTVEERIEMELQNDRPTTIISTKTGQKVDIDKLIGKQERKLENRKKKRTEPRLKKKL